MLVVGCRVSLSDDLAVFMNDPVRHRVFESVDHLFAHAVILVRTPKALGNIAQICLPSPPPPVDATRHAFDGPALKANLVNDMERRRADEKKPK